MKNLMLLMFVFVRILNEIDSVETPKTAQEIELFINNGMTPAKCSNSKYPLSWRQIQKNLTVRKLLQRSKSDEFKDQIKVWTVLGGKWLRRKWQLEAQKSEKSHFNKLFRKATKEYSAILREEITNSLAQKKLDHLKIIELLITSTNAEKDAAGINADLCNSLNERKKMCKNIRNILIAFCCKRRNEIFSEWEGNVPQIYGVIRQLNQMVSKPDALDPLTGFDPIVVALSTFSYPYLRFIFYEFKQTFGYDIDEKLREIRIKSQKFTANNRNYWEILYAIILDIQLGRPYFLAELLMQKLQNLRKFEYHQMDAISRFFLIRAPIDLVDINEEFVGLQGYSPMNISEYLETLINGEKDNKSNNHILETIKTWKEIVEWSIEHEQLRQKRVEIENEKQKMKEKIIIEEPKIDKKGKSIEIYENLKIKNVRMGTSSTKPERLITF